MTNRQLAVVLATLPLTLFLSWTAPSRADTFVVDCAGGNESELIDAMTTANLSDDPDLIWIKGPCVFDNAGGGDELSSHLPPVTTPMSLVGVGKSPAILEAAAEVGERQRLFLVESSGHLRLVNLSLQGSSAYSAGALFNLGELDAYGVTFENSTSVEFGGALRNSGSARLVNVTFDNNETGFFGGAIYNDGNLHVARSSFLNNSDIENGGGIYNVGSLTVVDSYFYSNHSEDGGAIDSSGDLVIKRSVFLENGGVDAGVLRIGGGTAHIADSTFLDNFGFNGGGGILIINSSATLFRTTISGSEGNYGAAALFAFRSTVLVDRCTISDNYTREEGSSIAGSGFTIVNSTLSGNRGNYGVAIHLTDSTLVHNTIWNNDSPIMLRNSSYRGNILGNSTGETACTIVDSTSEGFNLASDDSCGLQSALGDLPDTDPLLGPLEDNGGPTFTHLPEVASPAISGVPAGECTRPEGSPLFYDQRGVKRPIHRSCDIGSVERRRHPWRGHRRHQSRHDWWR